MFFNRVETPINKITRLADEETYLLRIASRIMEQWQDETAQRAADFMIGEARKIWGDICRTSLTK